MESAFESLAATASSISPSQSMSEEDDVDEVVDVLVDALISEAVVLVLLLTEAIWTLLGEMGGPVASGPPVSRYGGADLLKQLQQVLRHLAGLRRGGDGGLGLHLG